MNSPPESATERFPHLATMNQAQLIKHRSTLIGDATTYEELPQEKLEELSATLTLLRKGTSGPPKEAKKKTPQVEDVL